MEWEDALEGYTAHTSRKLYEIKPRNEILMDEGNIGIFFVTLLLQNDD